MRNILAGAIIAVTAGAAWAADPVVINGEAGFPEGPVMSGDSLLYAEYGNHKISRWDGQANTALWSQDGCGPSAVVPYGEGFAVTCYDSGQIVTISAEGETLASYDKDDKGMALVGPNDGTPDGQGGVNFTASGPWESAPIVGRLLHLGADGKISELADDLHYANGAALSPDGQRLYLAESEAGRVITFAVGADGRLSDRRLFVRLTDLDEPVGAYPDGLKIGPGGDSLYIGLYSAGRILEVDGEGKLLRKLEVPSTAAPNPTFSADGATIYVMAVGDTSNPPYLGKVYELSIK